MLRSKNEHVSYNVFESMKFNNEETQCYKTNVVEDLLGWKKTVVNCRNLMSEDDEIVLEMEASKTNNLGQKKEVFKLS